IPVIPVASTCVNVSDYGRGLLMRHGLNILGGLNLGLGALGHMLRWLENRGQVRVAPARSVSGGTASARPAGPWSEEAARQLLAGVTVDPAFGPVLAVGLGGIWVEVLNDTSLRLLPVDAAEIRRMLGELRGLPLLQGARGAAPANLDAVAEAIAGLGEVALT